MSEKIQMMDSFFAVDRFLRGGGGGGGGGGFGGGGSFSASASGVDSSTGSGGGKSSGSASLGFIILGVIILGFCCTCAWFMEKRRQKKHGSNERELTVIAFDTAVSKARQQTDNIPSKEGPSDMNYQVYKATYDTEYQDRGKILSAVMNICLNNDNISGYKVEGKGSDVDGDTTIIDGFVRYSGEGWWLEKITLGKDVGLRVLSEGKFDFSEGTFAGKWRSSNGYRGKYIQFKARNVFTTPLPLPIAQTVKETEVPTAVGVIEQPPVVMANNEEKPVVKIMTAPEDQETSGDKQT